jgi:hypothetical protein
MRALTAELWAEQDRHPGDRHRLFSAVAEAVDAERVLYPGSWCDIAASFVWPSVTYVDNDRRAARFFDDADGVREIVAAAGGPADAHIRFIPADYTQPLPLDHAHFDLLVSLYSGPLSGHCTPYLRLGGMLLANASHGDVALASIDPRYELAAVVLRRGGGYRVSPDDLGSHLVPKRPIEVTRELIERTGRGIAYTKFADAYLFRRTC